ncbi:MAG: exodeoxyribonuclease VII large subunit [Pseudomonadota bacterium]
MSETSEPVFGNVHEYSVSELSAAVKRSIEDGFGFVRVRGELGRVSRPQSGHVYLDLKDERAVLSGVIWKGNAARLKIAPEQGMEVVATGRLTTFPGQSRYQIVIDSLEPAGVGALMALFEERKKKLAAEGLFDAEKKKPLPYLPRVIGVVTSPSGAVIRDILHRLRDRFPSHVLLWPTVVQGRGAEAKIAEAIDGLNRLGGDAGPPRPDVIIVARGGGSLEDLWCFNEEAPARAAARSAIPVISAVGHETDTTLIDYAADRRAPTPTAAAEMATPVRSELYAEILGKERRLLSASQQGLERRRVAVQSASRGLGRAEDLLGPSAQRLDRASDRLRSGLRSRVDRASGRLAAARLTPAALSTRLRENDRRLREAYARFRVTRQTALDARSVKLSGVAVRLPAALRVVTARSAVQLAKMRLPTATLSSRVGDAAERLEQTVSRLAHTPDRVFNRRQDALAHISAMLASLSYERVLQRGFVLVRGPDGGLFASASEGADGAPVTLQFADGHRDATLGAAPSLTTRDASGTPKSAEERPKLP